MTEYDLKKQSQFSNDQNDFKSILTMVYGDYDGPGQRKNKANQSQFQSQNYPKRGRAETRGRTMREKKIAYFPFFYLPPPSIC